MKKAILMIAALGLSIHGMAQEKYVVSALTDVKQEHWDEAKEDIDKGMNDPETAKKPKALLAKAQIYNALQGIDKYKATNPYRDGAQAAIKLTELKADYEKSTVDAILEVDAFLYYNDGVKAYNDSKYTEAMDCAANVVKIHDLEGGKRFEKFSKIKTFDTLYAQAYQIMAKSNFYLSKYDVAIPQLVNVKNNPITRNPPVYECLIDYYEKQNDQANALASIQEAKKYFPDDENIRTYELNYYIKSGKQDEMVKKLEEAAVKDPKNPDIFFNIATTYLNMANPKDKPKPANSSELYAKSENAFQRTVAIDPTNAVYNYNFGALYFNQATDVNDQMNAITGTSDADQKKYDALKAQRDGLFAKSMPYFEAAYTKYSGTEANMKDEDRKTYKQTLSALQQIYLRENKLDKAAEMKKKYESI
jgi:hypothetical protein